jgi:hypothetical protein
MKKRGALGTAASILILGAGALSVSAQSLNWNDGDLLDQFGLQRTAAPAQISVPVAKDARDALVIDAVETVVGKFHRYDSQVHPYAPSNFWTDFVGSGGGLSSTPVRDDSDGSVTIEFGDLEGLLRAVVATAKQKGATVAVLNIHAHGLPGGTWFPKDSGTRAGGECRQWLQMAEAPDKDAYDEYYSAIPKEEIMSIRSLSQRTGGHSDCVSGAAEWRQVAARVPGLTSVFAPGAQVHFDSCVVGLGAAGEDFTEAVARTLFPSGGGNVLTSTDFGMGDWSMSQGMGFWDYQNDAQLRHDNEVYPVDRRDSELAQKGTVRVASYAAGSWTTFLVGGRDTMPTDAAPLQPTGGSEMLLMFSDDARTALPAVVRIPGTRVYANVR